jgi:hypothetical protein
VLKAAGCVFLDSYAVRLCWCTINSMIQYVLTLNDIWCGLFFVLRYHTFRELQFPSAASANGVDFLD